MVSLHNLISCSSLLVAAATGVAAQVALTPMLPQGPWTIDTPPAGCAVSRNYGAGETAIKLTLSQGFAPMEIDVAVGGAGSSALRSADRATLAGAGTVIETARFGRLDPAPAEERYAAGTFMHMSAFRAPSTHADLTFIDNRRPVTILTVSHLAAGLIALRNCQDDLYRSAGVDPASMRRIAVDAEPHSDAMWATSDDLPEQFARLREPLTATMRLDINTEGLVSRCAVTGSTGHQLLDIQSCRVLVARARYRPARDADGAAVPTIKMKRIRWQTPF